MAAGNHHLAFGWEYIDQPVVKSEDQGESGPHFPDKAYFAILSVVTVIVAAHKGL